MSVRSRLVVALAAATVGLSVLTLPSAAAPTGDPADAAAGWLGRQFVEGNHLETSFEGTSFPDAGLTIDGVIALTAAGVGGDTADAAIAWLGDPSNVGGYVGDGETESYAGSLAKLALGAQVRGADPTDFGGGGVDLLARLTARQQDSGRFSDQSQYGDFSGTFSQSFALLALERAGVSAPVTSGTAYLTGQQCDDGGFPQSFDGQTCTSQVDATALAVQALLAVGAADAAADAVDYLEAQQDDDGGYDNANSTGLAAAALAVAGSDAAEDAVDYLLALQQGCSAAAGDRGGIAFDASGFDDRAARATTQAVPGLVGADLATLSASASDADDLPTLDCSGGSSTTSTSAAGSSSSTSSTTPGSSTTLPSSPPQGDPLTSLSRTSVPAGGAVSVNEPGFVPGEEVRIVLWSEPVLLARVTADGTGRVSATVTIPAGTPTGQHTLALLGGSATKVATVTVTASSTPSTSGGGIPRTGAEALEVLQAGALALAVGTVLVVAARRRRASA